VGGASLFLDFKKTKEWWGCFVRVRTGGEHPRGRGGANLKKRGRIPWRGWGWMEVLGRLLSSGGEVVHHCGRGKGGVRKKRGMARGEGG